MKKRIFVIGDIHGGYKALKQVIQRAQIMPEDQLIFLGDYVDGWSDAPKVISYLIKLSQTHTCVFLRGNHDALFEKWLDTKEENKLWLKNGGNATVTAYRNLPDSMVKKHRYFLTNLKDYHIDDQNRLFLHAGFTNLHGPKREYYTYVFYWDRTLWETALATDEQLKPSDIRYPKRFTHFAEIFIGHTPVTKLKKTLPFQALNVWNLDTGAGFMGKLSMMEINTHTVFQSDTVSDLYPGERGRN